MTMRTKTIGLVRLGCLSLWLVGCASESKVSNEAQAPLTRAVPTAPVSNANSADRWKIAKIKLGETTEDQLLAWFGPTSSREFGTAGEASLRWTLKQSSENLVVFLDPHGKVSGVAVFAQ